MIESSGIVVFGGPLIYGSVEIDSVVSISGSLSTAPAKIKGILTNTSFPIISYISKVSGRWGDLIDITVENLPAYYRVTLGGIGVEIVGINGKDITWRVPSIPVGERTLQIETLSAPPSEFLLLEDGSGNILLEDNGRIGLESN